MFKETYINDIIGRHNIKNKAEFEELIDILSSAIGSLTNPKNYVILLSQRKIKSSVLRQLRIILIIFVTHLL